MTVRTKLFLGLLIPVPILVIAGIWSLRHLETQMRRSIGESSKILARSVLDQLEGDVYRRVEQARELASMPEVRSLLARSNESFAEIGAPAEIEAWIDAQDHRWRAWQGGAGAGPPAVLEEVDGHPVSERLRHRLAFLTEELGQPVFAEVFVTNRFGANAAQTAVTSDYRQDDEPWWTAGREDGVWIGPVELDESTGVHSVAFAVRVTDPAGVFLGVLKAVLNIDEIYRVLGGFEDQVSAADGVLELLDAGGGTLYPELGQAAAAARETVGAPDRFWIERLDGRELLRASAGSGGHRRYPSLGWRIRLSYPTGTIFAPVTVLRRQLAALVVAVSLAGLLAALWVSMSIARPIRASVAAADRLADGELGVEVEERASGEAGKLLAAMRTLVENLRRIVSSLVATSDEIGTLAGGLTQTSRQISQGALDQTRASASGAASVEQMAASVELVADGTGEVSAGVLETSSSIEEMTTSIETVARNTGNLTSAVGATRDTVGELAASIDRVATAADTAGGLADSAVVEAGAGGDAVFASAAGIEELAGTIAEIVRVNERLASSGQRIDRVNEVIDEIASQTSLLALNAAIQAAHAGEEGRGFAVVADEIKRLAERSVDSVKEISQLVREVQDGTAEATGIAQLGAEKVRRSVELTSRAEEILKRIGETIAAVRGQMQEIRRVTADQAGVAVELVRTFEQMTRMTGEVETATREHAVGSERIRQAMGQLTAVSRRVSAAVRQHRGDGAQVTEAIDGIAAIAARNAENAAEIAKITDDLRSQAEALGSLAAFFTLEDRNGGRPSR